MNQQQLELIDSGHCHQKEPERVQKFCHEERNIITGSPAVHGPVRHPLRSMQIDFPDTTGAILGMVRELRWLIVSNHQFKYNSAHFARECAAFIRV